MKRRNLHLRWQLRHVATLPEGGYQNLKFVRRIAHSPLYNEILASMPSKGACYCRKVSSLGPFNFESKSFCFGTHVDEDLKQGDAQDVYKKARWRNRNGAYLLFYLFVHNTVFLSEINLSRRMPLPFCLFSFLR